MRYSQRVARGLSGGVGDLGLFRGMSVITPKFAAYTDDSLEELKQGNPTPWPWDAYAAEPSPGVSFLFLRAPVS